MLLPNVKLLDGVEDCPAAVPKMLGAAVDEDAGVEEAAFPKLNDMVAWYCTAASGKQIRTSL